MAESRDITFSANGRTSTGYLADGSGGKPAPGVLVVHEATGLGPHARSKANLLAAQGYVAYAVDLFGGPVASMDDAMAQLGALVQDNAEWRARLTCALDALRAQPNVDASRLAAIGFCFGGSSVIELARSGADVKATVGFHSGLAAGRAEDSANIKGKLMVCIGNADPLIPHEQVSAFMANMEAAGVDCQLLLMTGVEHSFTNSDAAAMNMAGIKYDVSAERRSWAAMKGLFDEAF